MTELHRMHDPAPPTGPGSPAPALDPTDWDAFREFAQRVVADTLDHTRSIRETPAWLTMPAGVRRELLETDVPRAAGNLADAYADYVRLVRPYPSGNLHPRSWGWVRGNGTPIGALADFLASSLNPNTGGFDQAPVLVERTVIRWFAELLGFPAQSGGVLSSGGSMANVLGLTVARNAMAGYNIRAEGLHGTRPRMLVYGSTETHGWIKKGCELLGLGHNAFRRVPVDAEFRIDVPALREAIARDRADGHQPFCVIGTTGTVNTGATDDLVALADVCAEEKLWFHVDGAFGALLALCPGYAPIVRGMDRADSVAFDLHKWGYLPFDIACTLVRREPDLVSTFSVQASYLQVETRGATANQGFFFADRGVELSRDFKALKVWLSLRVQGVDAWAANIAQNITQVQRAVRLVEAHDELELLASAPLNVFNYRWAPPFVPAAELDDINREILLRLQERGIALPSATTLPRGFAIRCANTNHRTRDDDFDALLEATVALGHELWAERTSRSARP